MGQNDFDITDIFKKLDDIVDKIKDDDDFIDDFKKDPVKALESVLGVNLPDEKVNDVVDFIKTKLTVDKVGDFFEDIFKK